MFLYGNCEKSKCYPKNSVDLDGAYFESLPWVQDICLITQNNVTTHKPNR